MFTILLSILFSIEADFTQTKSVAIMSEPQVTTGHMVYHAPDTLQWSYLTPNTVAWEMNGAQSNVNPQVQGLLRMIMACIEGQDMNDPKMKREYKRFFRSIEIEMDESGNVAKRVQLVEKNGDVTLIEFNNVITK